jgi:ketosteroid isomerase-like protein
MPEPKPDADLAQALADRLAVEDVVVRYFELVDAKAWDRMDEVFTDDTTARWTPEVLVQGRDRIVAATRHMIASDEIVTHHLVAAMTPVVDGDTAEVTVRVRAMHHGVGARDGKFYESLGVQPTRLARTPDGWRIAHHEWIATVKLGDMEQLFAPEIAAGKKH